jgi:hypothetical protein
MPSFHIRSEALNALLDSTPFDRDHFREELLSSPGGAPAQVALAAFGAHHNPAARQPKAFGCRFVGFDFVVSSSLFSRHDTSPFRQNARDYLTRDGCYTYNN